MRIAVMVNSLVNVGGIAKHTLRASRELARIGHDVDVWAVEYDPANCYPELAESLRVTSLHGPGAEKIEVEGFVPGMRMAAHLAWLWDLRRDQHRLAQIIPAGYDVVHPNGNEIIWAAATYKRMHGAPVVWMCNDFWPIASQRYTRSSGLARRLRTMLKATLAAPFEREDRAAVQQTDRIAVLSKQVQRQMAEHYGVNPTIVRAGVDADRFDGGDRAAGRARLGVGPDTFLLLTLCELMPRRRLEDVIRAVRLLRDGGLDVTYVVAGRTTQSPEYARYVQSLSWELGLDGGVKFTGMVPEDELADLYQASDAFVWASDENQSWGLAPMEAMAAGKPAVVSRANGLAEVLNDGENALLVEPRSPEAVVEAVRRLATDPRFRLDLAQRGRALVRGEYSWRRNAEQMATLFEEAVNPPARHEPALGRAA